MARKKAVGGDSNGPGRRDPRDVRIEHLEEDNARLERNVSELTEERDSLKRRNEHLEKELEAAQRAGKRQAAPFAKDRPQGSGKCPRAAPRSAVRKAGAPPQADAG